MSRLPALIAGLKGYSRNNVALYICNRVTRKRPASDTLPIRPLPPPGESLELENLVLPRSC